MAPVAMCHQHTVVTVLAHENEQKPSLVWECLVFQQLRICTGLGTVCLTERHSPALPWLEEKPQFPLEDTEAVQFTLQPKASVFTWATGELVLEPRGTTLRLCLPFPMAPRVLSWPQPALPCCCASRPCTELNALLTAAPQLSDILLKPQEVLVQSLSVWVISVSHLIPLWFIYPRTSCWWVWSMMSTEPLAPGGGAAQLAGAWCW